MPTYHEALQMVLDQAAPLPVLLSPLQDALGRVAGEDVCSGEPVPPFTNSAMDGYALRAADAAAAGPTVPVRLPVQGHVPAGLMVVPPLRSGAACRIMTGAAVPEGADAIVPLEEATPDEDTVVLTRAPRPGAHIRHAGEDIPAGGLVVPRGQVLRPAEIGVLAAFGCVRVPVHPRPLVSVLTTGDELVDAGDPPGPGQIRDANIHSLCAQVLAAGARPLPLARVPDRREAVISALERALGEADVILTNGGISVGDLDYVKDVLEGLGARRVFWRVAQKPGGPLGFWVAGSKLVFGIPGNPAAAMLMVEEYVRPALRRLMGFTRVHRPERTGVLEFDWPRPKPDPRLTFLRVVARRRGDDLVVALSGAQGSGVLSSLMRANALALIPGGDRGIPAGGTVPLHLLDEEEDH